MEVARWRLDVGVEPTLFARGVYDGAARRLANYNFGVESHAEAASGRSQWRGAAAYPSLTRWSMSPTICCCTAARAIYLRFKCPAACKGCQLTCTPRNASTCTINGKSKPSEPWRSSNLQKRLRWHSTRIHRRNVHLQHPQPINAIASRSANPRTRLKWMTRGAVWGDSLEGQVLFMGAKKRMYPCQRWSYDTEIHRIRSSRNTICMAMAGHSASQLSSALFTLATAFVVPFYTLMIVAPQWKMTRKVVGSYLPYVVLGGLYVYLLALSWTPETLGLMFASKYWLPELPGITRMFQSTVTVASAWIHLLAVDLFAARHVFLDGLNNSIETRHTLVLCLMFGPVGIFSHFVTKAFTKFWRAAHSESLEEKAEGLLN